MSSSLTNNVVERVRSISPSMPSAMLRISELVQQDPQAVLSMSISQLAEFTATSPATVTRFCKQVGFTGYVSFRVALAVSIGRHDKGNIWDTEIGRNFGPDETPDQILNAVLSAHMRTLQLTSSSLDIARIKRVATAIAKSRQLDIYGIGGSALVGRELQAQLFRIGINAHIHVECHAGLISGALLDSECVAIGISHSGDTEQTMSMLTVAKQSGALTVAVSGAADSMLARLADDCILTVAPDPYVKPENIGLRLGQMFIIDLIHLFVAQHDFERTSRNLSITAKAVSTRRFAMRKPRFTRSSKDQADANWNKTNQEKSDL